MSQRKQYHNLLVMKVCFERTVKEQKYIGETPMYKEECLGVPVKVFKFFKSVDIAKKCINHWDGSNDNIDYRFKIAEPVYRKHGNFIFDGVNEGDYYYDK